MKKAELEALLVKATKTISNYEDQIGNYKSSLEYAHLKAIDLAKEVDERNKVIEQMRVKASDDEAMYKQMVANAEDAAIYQRQETLDAESKYNEAVSMFADLLRELRIE